VSFCLHYAIVSHPKLRIPAIPGYDRSQVEKEKRLFLREYRQYLPTKLVARPLRAKFPALTLETIRLSNILLQFPNYNGRRGMQRLRAQNTESRRTQGHRIAIPLSLPPTPEPSPTVSPIIQAGIRVPLPPLLQQCRRFSHAPTIDMNLAAFGPLPPDRLRSMSEAVESACREGWPRPLAQYLQLIAVLRGLDGTNTEDFLPGGQQRLNFSARP